MNMTAGRVAVLLVDDHPVLTEALVEILGDEPDLDVVATAGSAAEALHQARRRPPDVALVDQLLPDGTGTDLARRLRAEHPDLAVVILSSLPEAAVIADAVDAGCAGLVSKAAHTADVTRALRTVAAGGSFFSPEAVRELIATRRTDGPAVLTSREVEVIRCLAEGLSNKAIAERLHLSANTVGNHLQHAMAKLGAHSKLEALVIGLQAGIVPAPVPTGRAGVAREGP